MNEEEQPLMVPGILTADNGPEGAVRYVAGVSDPPATGETLVELTVDQVQREVMSGHNFTVMCDASGEVVTCPTSLVEDVTDAMFCDGRLQPRAIDALVAEALELSHNEPAEQMIADLETMRDRLARSFAIVERAIEYYRNLPASADAPGAQVPPWLETPRNSDP
jgi:hypothetical protein